MQQHTSSLTPRDDLCSSRMTCMPSCHTAFIIYLVLKILFSYNLYINGRVDRSGDISHMPACVSPGLTCLCDVIPRADACWGTSYSERERDAQGEGRAVCRLWP